MRTFSILLGLALIAFCAGASAATIFAEDFNYSTGMLSNVSGGVWNTWGGASTDTVVMSRMLTMDGYNVPDVVAYHPNALPSLGTMTYSFDFFVHEEGAADIDTYYFIGAGNPGDNSIDYGNALGAFMIDWASPVGQAAFHAWDMDGANGGGDYGIAQLAVGLTLDAWHNVKIEAIQTVANPSANDPLLADGQFRVLLDAVEVLPWTNFGNNSPVGFNAIEIYSFDGGEEHDFQAIDKINIEFEPVPEPGMFALAGLGLLALIRRRK